MPDRQVHRPDDERSNETDNYWHTAISQVAPNRITIRGYPLEDLVGEISYVDAIGLCLTGEVPDKLTRRCLNAVLTSAIDHQFVNSTALAARTVVSGHPEPVVGMAAAVLTFGPVTGGAPADVIDVIHSIDESMAKGVSLREAARDLVARFRADRRRVPGIGHPLHPRRDVHYTTRSRTLRDRVVSYGLPERQLVKLEVVHTEVLHASGGQMPINVDGVIGAVLAELGFSSLQAKAIAPFTLLPGIAAHVVEEIEDGRPLRVVTEAGYTGIGRRRFVPDGSGPSPRASDG